MTASAAPTREIRALPMLTDLPAGCIAHAVPDETAAPHLRLGEFAVVDAIDREPAHGELFLMAYGSRDAHEARTLRIVEVRTCARGTVAVPGRPHRAPAAAFPWCRGRHIRSPIPCPARLPLSRATVEPVHVPREAVSVD